MRFIPLGIYKNQITGLAAEGNTPPLPTASPPEGARSYGPDFGRVRWFSYRLVFMKTKQPALRPREIPPSAYGISPEGGEVLQTRFGEESDGFHIAWVVLIQGGMHDICLIRNQAHRASHRGRRKRGGAFLSPEGRLYGFL